MSLRKHESGASKRKAQKIRKEYEAKLPKVSNFFQPIDNPVLGPKMTEVVREIDTNTNKLLDTNTDEVNII